MTRAFDVLGNIAIVHFRDRVSAAEKKKVAKRILNSSRSITTVLEKVGKVRGRLRKPELKFLVGEKTFEAKYTENGCVFRFNVATTYFSPRLSNERKEIAQMIKKGERVLVCFSGVAPFSVVIAKHSRASCVVSNEINRTANKYAKLNAELNKVKDKIAFWDGDIKRIAKKVGKMRSQARGLNSLVSDIRQETSRIKNVNQKFKSKLNNKESGLTLSKFGRKRDNFPSFDVIVMPRPQLKDTFLDAVFPFCKKGTRIFYYDFCKIEEIEHIVANIKEEARRANKKIRILKVKKAGEIAPYKIRVRVDFKVL